MKKLILALAAFPALAVNAQDRKVMLEDFTGTWCQFCPNGSKAIEDLDAQHGAKFIGIAVHNANGDPLEVADGKALVTGLGPFTYPNGAIDRKMSGGKYGIGINADGTQWKTAVTARLAVPAIASVSLANLKKNTDGTYEGDVIVKFTAAAANNVPIKVNVILTENKIPAEGTLKQSNVTKWYGGPGGGSPIYTTTTSSNNTFYHHHTLRTAVGGAWGWSGVVPNNPVVGTEYKKHFTFTLPATGIPGPWKPENMDVIAFAAYDGPAASDQKEIINAEKVKMSAFFPAGVKSVTEKISFVNAYPNPAATTDVVNIGYSIAESEKVTLKVYNTIGQMVAQPYNSEEVRGNHTIMWRPSDNALAPGLYILELSTATGKTTQRISLQ